MTVSQDLTADIGSNGTFINPVTVSAVGGDATITIAAGITGTGSDGKPITSISIAKPSEPPSPPPTGQNIISSVYEFGPSGAHFSSPIKITLQYFPVSGVDDNSLVIAYYSVSDGKWITLGGVVDSVNHTITIEVDHFTAFTVIGSIGTGSTAVSSASHVWWLWVVIGVGLFATGFFMGAGIGASRRKLPLTVPVSRVQPTYRQPEVVPVTQTVKPLLQSSGAPPAAQTTAQSSIAPPVVKPPQNAEVTPVKPPEKAESPEIAKARDAAIPIPRPAELPKMPVQFSEITVKLSKGDFTVTSAAVEKLSGSSKSIDDEEPRVLRITRMPGTPVQLRMFVDKRGPNDIVVLYNGASILFLSPEAAEILGGIAIDFQNNGSGGQFALKKRPV